MGRGNLPKKCYDSDHHADGYSEAAVTAIAHSGAQCYSELNTGAAQISSTRRLSGLSIAECLHSVEYLRIVSVSRLRGVYKISTRPTPAQRRHPQHPISHAEMKSARSSHLRVSAQNTAR
jgi:hypothetical protein